MVDGRAAGGRQTVFLRSLLFFIFEVCKQEAREEIREMEDPVTIN